MGGCPIFDDRTSVSCDSSDGGIGVWGVLDGAGEDGAEDRVSKVGAGDCISEALSLCLFHSSGSVFSSSSRSVQHPCQQSPQCPTSQLKQNLSILNVEQNIIPRLDRFILLTSDCWFTILRCADRL